MPPSARSVVLVAGARTPFALASTAHKSQLAVDLARMAVKGLLARQGLPPSLPQSLVLGTVLQEPRTSNVAREASLSAGLPASTFASTVTAACISANVAAQAVTDQILSGRISCGVAGGVELMSDVPIRFSRAVRARMIASQKAKGLGGYLGLLRGLRLADLAPEVPAVAEYSTGETMGRSSEKLAARWGVSRADADSFALRSHTLALKAHTEGRLVEDVLVLPHLAPAAGSPPPPALGPGSATWDNTVKADSTLAKLASLKPAFVKSPHATHTAGNSSPLTDGASAVLLMEGSRAAAEGLPALARIVRSEWVARSPVDELLLGPAYAVARLLHASGLSAADIDVLEIHEAFAGQVLANFNALTSPSFAWAADAGDAAGGGAGGTGKAVGLPPLERINAWGGSLSLGHPFGATGTRLLLTAARRLQAEGGRYAVVAACAAGGLGVATLLEAAPRGATAAQAASTAMRPAVRPAVRPAAKPLAAAAAAVATATATAAAAAAAAGATAGTVGGTAASSSGTAGGAPPPSIRVEEREGGIVVVTLDVVGEKLNILSEAVIRELGASMEVLQQRLRAGGAGAPRAVVLTSGKPGHFIAGADIKMLGQATTEAQWARLSSEGHRMMNVLARLPVPTVAAIDGACMGGGLELALACSARVCTPGAKMGLPEVKLGLLPGAGGCTRLPRLVGVQNALTFMTAGKTFRPDQALKLGLVSAVVEPQALLDAALRTARDLLAAAPTPAAAAAAAAAGGGGTRRPRSWLQWALEGNPLGRAVLWREARKAIDRETGGRYPAPYAILDAVRAGVEGGEAAGFAAEAAGFGRLGMTPESAALRGLFFSLTATKRGAGEDAAAAPLEVKTLGVLGAGLMGAGIALVAADAAGLAVVLRDRDAAALQRGEAQIAAALGAKVKRRRLTRFEADAVASRVLGATDADAAGEAARRALARAELVVEAVPEVLAIKHAVLREAQALGPPGAIFATNTSALPIADVARGAASAELATRVCGMHFFSPVDKMPLCEVIPHACTAPEVTATVVATAQAMGKTVITVKDVPGFFVNRCLSPLLSEMVALVSAGVPPPAIDAALTAYGMPVGPCALTDEVGIDVASHVSATMARALGVRMAGPDERGLSGAVAAGFTGRKGGKGFYLYPAGGDKKGGGGGGRPGSGGKQAREVNAALLKVLAATPPPGKGYDRATVAALAAPGAEAAERLRNRLVLRFLKECVHSLEDGVIRSAGDGDIGAVFGIGFPPNLGGPFRYLDQLGAAKVVAAMRELEASVGPQFEPPAMLVEMAKSGAKFHA